MFCLLTEIEEDIRNDLSNRVKTNFLILALTTKIKARVTGYRHSSDKQSPFSSSFPKLEFERFPVHKMAFLIFLVAFRLLVPPYLLLSSSALVPALPTAAATADFSAVIVGRQFPDQPSLTPS